MSEFETPELERRYGLVIEGICPHGHGPLDRHEDCGWCHTCGVGYSIRGDTVRLHADPARGTEMGYILVASGCDPDVEWVDITDLLAGPVTIKPGKPGPAPLGPDRKQD